MSWGWWRRYRGDFLAARAHLEHGCRLADAVPSPAPLLRGGFVRRVTLRTSLARVLWPLGYAEQARQRSQEALTLARQGDHGPTLAYAEHLVALVCQCRRDVAATQAHVDALLAVAAVHGLAFRTEQGRLLQGWTLAMQGEAAAGVAHLRQALASPDVGPESMRPYWLTTLAEVYGRAGQPQAGLQVLAEAVTLMATTEARWWEAELYRLQGELLLQLPQPRCPPGGSSVPPAGPGRGPSPAGEGVGAARRAEPRAALAESRAAGRGPTAAGGELQLVH